MIALAFPPSAAAAAIPAAQLATYLPEHGWHPTFLTIRETHLLAPHAAGQGHPLPWDRIGVRRTRICYPRETLFRALRRRQQAPAQQTPPAPAPRAPARPRRGLRPWVESALALPDEQCGWLPFALAAGLSLARGQRIDCLYSIGPPMTGHVVGLGLHRLLGCPWVADFHDPWLSNPWHQRRPWPWHGVEERLARAVLAAADHLLTKTPEMVDLMTAASGRPARDFTVAPCAYEAAEIAAAAPAARRDPKKLVLIHAGRFYGPRAPDPLLEALAQVAQDPALAARLELRLLGPRDPRVEAAAQRLGIGPLVHQLGLVSHRETLRHLLESDLAVVVQPATTVQVPSKLYEYLGCGVPVLALTEEGATARVVRAARAGHVAPPQEVAQIARALQSLMTGPPAEMDQQYLAQFEAQTVVANVARVLEEVVGAEARD